MSKKKKEVLDNLELATPEVETRIAEESGKWLQDKQDKYVKEALNTPAKILRGDLTDVCIFLSILIEKLDVDFFDENDMLSYKDDHDSWKYKDIHIKYEGNDGNKEFLLELLSHYIDALDLTRMRLFLENEHTESKEGNIVFKNWVKEQLKKREDEEKEEDGDLQQKKIKIMSIDSIKKYIDEDIKKEDDEKKERYAI